MGDYELWWKEGGIGNRRAMKKKEAEYSQRVWSSETGTTEGWKELVFHVCDSRD